MRSYYEHRAADDCKHRIAINEAAWPMRLLYLNNNYHLVHHDLPGLPWYLLARVYWADRDAYLARCGGFRIAGYTELVRRFGLTPVDAPVHPTAPGSHGVSGGPGPWRLALPMYNLTPELGRAWESLLLAVMDGLRQRGWSAPMQVAPLPEELFDLWRADDLLLSQTCGYPLVTALADDVQVLAAPAFDLPGCDGASYCSFIVVPQDGARTLEDLRGKVAAINQGHSQSGMNALRHTLAPLARSGRFLGRVETSGSHLASLALLQSGQADVAAIDCATFGLAQRHAPRPGRRPAGAAENRRGTCACR